MDGKLRVLKHRENESGSGITVLFEVAGEVYGEEFPVRKKHVFPDEARWFDEKGESGELRYIEFLKERYVDRVEEKKAGSGRLDKLRENNGRVF